MPLKDPEARRAYQREYAARRRREDPEFLERQRKASREHHARIRQHPRRNLDRKLRAIHRITLDEFEQMLEEQEHGCAICGEACRQEVRLSVDHDHETGEVRGLLCASCNNGLGRFGGSPELLRAAADYLERF